MKIIKSCPNSKCNWVADTKGNETVMKCPLCGCLLLATAMAQSEELPKDDSALNDSLANPKIRGLVASGLAGAPHKVPNKMLF